MRALFYFLFGSEYLPWPLQVLWKAGTVGMAALLVYAPESHDGADSFERAVCYTLAGLIFATGLLTKLGDG